MVPVFAEYAKHVFCVDTAQLSLGTDFRSVKNQISICQNVEKMYLYKSVQMQKSVFREGYLMDKRLKLYS